MQISMGIITVQLNEKKVFAFRGARHFVLQCIDGMVWLTVEGQSSDYILSKGEQFRMESNGLALIQGVPSGEVQLVNTVINAIRQRATRDDFIDLNLSGRRDLAARLSTATLNGSYQ